MSTFLLSKLKPILMDSLQIHGLFAMFSCKKINISFPTLLMAPVLGTVLAVILLMSVFKPTSSKEVDKV